MRVKQRELFWCIGGTSEELKEKGIKGIGTPSRCFHWVHGMTCRGFVSRGFFLEHIRFLNVVQQENWHGFKAVGATHHKL